MNPNSPFAFDAQTTPDTLTHASVRTQADTPAQSHASATARTQADIFRGLHFATHRPLALANAWDASSARIIEAVGAPAIATTSAGIAWSLGRPDGDALSREESIEAIARIISVVSVPVSADLEGGYAQSPDGVAQTVTAAIQVGVAGINIEDGARDPHVFAERVSAARQAAERAGVPIFINARTDVYLAGLVEPERMLEETCARAALYISAGADGIFVPGVADPNAIRELVTGISAPLNVMVGSGAPTVAELADLGVARVSLGSGVAQAAYAVAQNAALELQNRGSYDALSGAADYAELNALFASRDN